MTDEAETERDRLEQAVYTALANYAAYLDRIGMLSTEDGICIVQKIIAGTRHVRGRGMVRDAPRVIRWQ